jgi:hypothetical protein
MEALSCGVAVEGGGLLGSGPGVLLSVLGESVLSPAWLSDAHGVCFSVFLGSATGRVRRMARAYGTSL